jgi:aminomuconate-semialdehyde/2-hydroxymuconate-6-semialdehyde dehydrogenase
LEAAVNQPQKIFSKSRIQIIVKGLKQEDAACSSNKFNPPLHRVSPSYPVELFERMSSIATAGAEFFSASFNESKGGEEGSTKLELAQQAAIRSLQGVSVRDDGVVYLRNFTSGAYGDPQSNTYMDVIDPSTGKLSCRVPRSNEDDANAAIQVAHDAHLGWANTPNAQRAIVLEKTAQLLRERAAELGLCESCDVGKPAKLAQTMDIPRAAENFDFFARMIRTDSTSAHHMADAVNITQRCAVGVSTLITPWNLPLYLLTWKVAPALACGNAVVVKPSELTPITATALAGILHEAGLPPGVFNLVHGTGMDIGTLLTSHKLVRLVSFTGGTVTGRKVAASAAPSFKKCSLELGGKNPAIVFADADLEEAAEHVARGSFLNSGQICLCCPRTFD